MSRSRRSWLPLAGALLIAALALPERHASARVLAAPAGKTCKTVKKHGKKVRVCKGTKAPVPPTPTPTATVPPLRTTPNPQAVGVQVDESRAASAAISPDGGAIHAVATDGAEFTLTVPKNAVLETAQITMTPISRLDRVPLSGGMVAGVRLAPEGLQFYAPVTLEIDLPAAVPVQTQMGFTSAGDGAEWHLYPQTFEPRRVTMTLLHFSTYGVGTGSGADVVSAGQHPPTSWQAQLEQLRGMLAIEHEAQVTGTPSPYPPGAFSDQFKSVARSIYDQVVKPKMDAAASSLDEAVVTDALRTALGWERQVELTGLSEQFAAEETSIRTFMNDAIDRLLKDAEATCGTRARTLFYAGPQLGWFVDKAGANKITKYAHIAAVLGMQTSGSIYTALAKCRPRGFKVQGLQMHWHWTETAGVSTDEDRLSSGSMCGSDPQANPWKFEIKRLIVISGSPTNTNDGGTFDVTLGSDFRFSSTSPTMSDLFGATFFGGNDVTMALDPEGLQVSLKVHVISPSYGAATISPQDQTDARNLEENMDCPAPTG